ncbi:MAG: DUF2294 family protein [Chitinivibrionales bacterium]|nr:DUF2294 family protein [Chitinivibrionales bacterium]MBD3356109.1 DUF2294 family protein [Chitinivibrionales bacterium]
MTQRKDEISNVIAEVVRSFLTEQLGMHPEKISVDIHNQLVTVTLEGVSNPGEMDLAKERPSRAMIEKVYMELFSLGDLSALPENALA